MGRSTQVITVNDGLKLIISGALATLSGEITSANVVSSGTVVGTIPEIYRPKHEIRAVAVKAGATMGGANISTGGTIRVYAGTQTNVRVDVYAASWWLS